MSADLVQQIRDVLRDELTGFLTALPNLVGGTWTEQEQQILLEALTTLQVTLQQHPDYEPPYPREAVAALYERIERKEPTP